MDLESEWLNFIDENNDNDFLTDNDTEICKSNNIPKCSDIYISTKTKIAYLDTDIDLHEIFWKIKLIQYHESKEGVIKKQMKFNSLTKEEYSATLENIEKEKQNNYIEDYVIQHVDMVNGNKSKFKNIRKVSVGISKKDIMSYRSKPKSAFYNCFVILARLLHEDSYKEIHIKVFNTGKIEIPGIQNDCLFNKSLSFIKNLVQIFIPREINYIEDKIETVLINSNFTCGFLINREKLFNKLKTKYRINASYDPCSYPGIQCKYKTQSNNVNYEVSFMIFRTGSILIVGKCNEIVLYEIYNFLKNILHEEYDEIKQSGEIPVEKKKNKKVRKKKIFVTS